ncbi:MAG: hypothetical protein EA401_05995 [Planctomycetota bacterium]|nr:MAG: hypothetical protein EA401_05995 [Planctomycetota bacterium]
MKAPQCATCDDFGWVPKGAAAGWYRREWRVVLDPAVEWQRCPDCGGLDSGISGMQEALASILLQRLIVCGEPWQQAGRGWLHGRLEDCPLWSYEHRLIAFGPGSANPHPWQVISAMGVMRDLSSQQCLHHIQRAGFPLPDLDHPAG